MLATNWFAGFGGSETYLLTVAEQLSRLGHDATIHARELGAMAEFARRRGVRVVGEEDLPVECDAILAQDGITAYALAARHRRTPQVFVAHSALFDVQAPPQVDGLVSAVVALNDPVEARAKAMATPMDVVRMRQPVDLRRFSPRGDIRRTPKRALLFSNHLFGRRYEMVADACAALDIECVRVGHYGASDPEPERWMADADIVFGYGRCIVEAMSCGRAAFVYDHRGGHGWVTPESYPELEADGLTGSLTGPVLDAAALERALKEYRPEMGLANRELAQAHHSARRHTEELIALLRRLPPRSRAPSASLGEMARLHAISWRHEIAAAAREREASELRDRIHALEGRVRELEEQGRGLQEEMDREAGQLRHRVEVLRGSRRYRLGSFLLRPVDLWRRIRGSDAQQP